MTADGQPRSHALDPSPAGARIGAFFDIDHTVLEINSGTKWIGYQWKNKRMTVLELARALRWSVEYRFGLLDFEAMAGRLVAQYRGQEIAPVEQEVAAWFRDEIAATICTEARATIEEHREAGHVLALLTSATRFLSAPVGQALQVEHVLCTEVGEHDGRFTGTHLPPACYGPGKVVRAEAFASEHGIDLQRSFFYSDSYSDLPMLERVGEPRVVNPDPRLRRVAQRRGWDAQIWRAPPPGPLPSAERRPADPAHTSD